MAQIPKIDSEGLRLAKAEADKRVSSVARVSLIEAAGHCFGRNAKCPRDRNGGCAKGDDCRIRRAYGQTLNSTEVK